MIVCRKCGFRNQEGDAFCGSCGGFLEWTGEKQEPAVAKEIVEEVHKREQETAAAPRVGLLSRVIHAANVAIAGPSAEAGAGAGAGEGGGGEEANPFGAFASMGFGEPASEPAPEPEPVSEPESVSESAPEPEAGAESETEAEPKDGDEPKAEAEAAAGSEAKAESEAAAKDGDEPKVEAETEPKPDAEPEPTAEATSEAELKDLAESKPGLKPKPQPEPEAASKTEPAPPAPPESPEPPEPPLAIPARAPDRIREQAPGVAKARPVAVTKTAPSRRLLPGDLVCGSCGEGNPSSRRFCSRCGVSLVAAVAVKEPWWRRFIPKRGPRVVKLGQGTDSSEQGSSDLAKPRFDLKFGLRQIYRKGRVVVGVVILVGGLVYGAYPPFRSMVNGRVKGAKTSVMNAIGDGLQPIRPAGQSASAAMAGHPAAAAADLNTNTYWAAPWSMQAEATLTFDFGRRVTLKKIIVYSGAADAYTQDGRPSELVLKYSDGESSTIAMSDTPKQQEFPLSHAAGVTSVTIQVGSVYPDDAETTVAVADVEFFGLPL
ncbi:hypothetical protein ABIA35_004380 [Catenulispora sp. MAP12-49]|uniref:NADase-type glycan-binding domain-containing protein n=1 Tax=Catenulispora sp. MAP12-49 TaxID=3156302 RepID=UPI0035177DCD